MVKEKLLLSGNEAVARAALDAGIALGVGYPGTPSTEILETLSAIGGKAQWSPNEKTALETGIGSSFSGARTLVTMKHVGVNVAADPLFTVAYTGTKGGLIIISADDPGMASSQNEQDNRHYGRSAGVPVVEPSDSQEAYDLLFDALTLSEENQTPVIFRLTTRICHSKTVVQTKDPVKKNSAQWERNIKERVMVPAYARPAHKRLRAKLAKLAEWNESSSFTQKIAGEKSLGIISSGVAYTHAKEAAPEASFLKLGLTYPLPIKTIKDFAASVEKCLVIEEGDPVLVDAIRAAGIEVDGKPEMYRFGELNVERVKRIIANDTSEEPAPTPGRPPQLCVGCPHRKTFETLRDMGCIVAGDIGCYTLGVLPPFEAMDTCVCMGASITVGLGMRESLPREDAKKVVSVIGDSTFVHSGLTGIAHMTYNRPDTGHLVIILDNSTTAMTGLQEHPGTGRKLDHTPAYQLVIEDVVKAMGIDNVHVINPLKETEKLVSTIKESLEKDELSVIIARQPCILATGKIKKYNEANQQEDK